MSIELRMEGELGGVTQEEFSKQLKQLCETKQLRFEDYGDTHLIRFCPEGVIQCTYAKDFVTIETQSDLGGAGYHAAACAFMEIIQEHSKIDFTLVDQSDYASHHDFHKLEQHFYEMLNAFRDEMEMQRSQAPIYVGFDDASDRPKAKDDHIMTPMGYLAFDDLMYLDDETLAERLFVWNHETRDAQFYRNSALCLLWKDCYFMYSNMNDQTNRIAAEIVDRLEIAYEMDPEIALPMHAYTQLCQILGRAIRIQMAHKLDETEPIGYRLYPITYAYDNWRIDAPGTCERNDDISNHTFVLSGPYENEDSPWSWLLKANMEKPLYAYHNSTSVEIPAGTLTYVSTAFEEYHTIDAFVSHGDETLSIQIVYQDESFYDDALAILRSIYYQKKESVSTDA